MFESSWGPVLRDISIYAALFNEGREKKPTK